MSSIHVTVELEDLNLALAAYRIAYDKLPYKGLGILSVANGGCCPIAQAVMRQENIPFGEVQIDEESSIQGADYILDRGWDTAEWFDNNWLEVEQMSDDEKLAAVPVRDIILEQTEWERDVTEYDLYF